MTHNLGKITVALDPEEREKFVNRLLLLDGLGTVVENPLAAYCPISLTATPTALKPFLAARQASLMNEVLTPVGISAYDPASAPYSPDVNLTSQPAEVYLVDSAKIASARIFTGHDLIPSTGLGIELEKAKFFNRVAVILRDKNIRVSRMQPNKAILLEYENFQEQVGDFQAVFSLLNNFDPGVGFHGDIPVLLGFEKNSNKIVDLEETVYLTFPHLQYKYRGEVPIIRLRAENPELFREYQQ